MIGCNEVLPEPCTIRVPCIDTKSSPKVIMHDDMSIMLPHEWLASVADLPEAESLLGLSKTPEFWDHVSSHDPRLLAQGGHPVLNEAEFKSTFIPLWVHGDGVEYSEDDSLLVFTFGSCLTTTNSMLAMFYLASFVKSVTATVKKSMELTPGRTSGQFWSGVFWLPGKANIHLWTGRISPLRLGVDLLPVLGRHCAKGLSFWCGV